jgi:IS30 family transposase
VQTVSDRTAGANGFGFAAHEYIAKKLNTKFYFAYPYSSWERELNEYTNGLIRQLSKVLISTYIQTILLDYYKIS